MGHSREVKRTKNHIVEEYLTGLASLPEVIVIGDSEKDMLLAHEFHGKGYWYRHPGLEIPPIVKNQSNLIAINDLRDVLLTLQ